MEERRGMRMSTGNQFLMELELLEQSGVRMKLGEQVATPQKIFETCMVKEKMQYMCDFIFEEDQRLSELHFDKIEKCRSFDSY